MGKPSAGKSSFFNAATHTQGARVGAHPFTTIEPNTGVALVHVRAPTGAPCRTVAVPVVLKDVAGLVPGACDGRGRGNRFLNDLCDADALVHITDASASADANGNLVVAAPQAGVADGVAAERAPGATSMREDVAWVHRELSRWVYDNVADSWDKVLRRPAHLFNLFTGYHAPPALAEKALHVCAPPPPPLERARAWCADDVCALVDSFLALRFGTVICANKADLRGATVHIELLRAELARLAPALAAAVVPCSALAEGELQRLEREGIVALRDSCGAGADGNGAPLDARADGDGEGTQPTVTVTVTLLCASAPSVRAGGGADDGTAHRLAPRDAHALELARRCGFAIVPCGEDGARALAQLSSPSAPAERIAGGVQATLQRAFWLRPPVVAFPVCDLLTARSYPLSEAALREGGDASADRAHVRDVVLLRPGSTVGDLFAILCHAPYRLLGGEFVRAEGRPLDEPRAVRQLRKDEPVAQGCVIKLYSTRKGQRVKQ